jgi:hypothetical protein
MRALNAIDQSSNISNQSAQLLLCVLVSIATTTAAAADAFATNQHADRPLVDVDSLQQ